MRFRILIAVAVLAATTAAAAPAIAKDDAPTGPSFNCRKARTWVERTVCRDPVLADKDQRMATAYISLVEQAREGGGPGTDLSNFRNEQRRWLAKRNRCRNTACLNQLYDQRISDVTVDY